MCGAFEKSRVDFLQGHTAQDLQRDDQVAGFQQNLLAGVPQPVLLVFVADPFQALTGMAHDPDLSGIAQPGMVSVLCTQPANLKEESSPFFMSGRETLPGTASGAGIGPLVPVTIGAGGKTLAVAAGEIRGRLETAGQAH